LSLSLDLNIEHNNHHGQVVVVNRHHRDPWNMSSPAWPNCSCMQMCSCLSSLPLNKKSVEKSSAFHRGHRKLPIFSSTVPVQEAGESAITIINILEAKNQNRGAREYSQGSAAVSLGFAAPEPAAITLLIFLNNGRKFR
jgi:hypothetical protein